VITAAWFDVATIRDVTEDDWQLLRTIRLWALRDAPHAFTADYDHEAGHDEWQWRELLLSDLWLLAFEDGITATPVGVIAATQDPTGEYFISSLWVDPGHRRRGIARGLIQAVTDRVAARGAEAVSLWVLEGNDVAHQVYAAVGFVPTGERQLAPGSSTLRERRMRRSVR
jgi:ribosomal protein S18 acetylase RimI-like enzyme